MALHSINPCITNTHVKTCARTSGRGRDNVATAAVSCIALYQRVTRTPESSDQVSAVHVSASLTRAVRRLLRGAPSAPQRCSSSL